MMSWIIYCVLIALTIYLIYNGAALKLFGIPSSLSMTYYLFKEKKSWMRVLFPAMMTLIVFLLLPAWLEISVLSPWQFTAFFAISGILFTGAAPEFINNPLEKVVHTSSTIIASIFAIAWILLVSKLWWIILIWLEVVLLIMLITKTTKSSYIYWLETIAFLSTFTSIITYYFI